MITLEKYSTDFLEQLEADLRELATANIKAGGALCDSQKLRTAASVVRKAREARESE